MASPSTSSSDNSQVRSLTPRASALPPTNKDVAEVKRILAEATELEEVKEALQKMITKVEQLNSLLAETQSAKVDLETSLVLTKSNLTLAIANNEMLEEALQREGNKDVGWRRWSEREGLLKKSLIASGSSVTPNNGGSDELKRQRTISGVVTTPPSRGVTPEPTLSNAHERSQSQDSPSNTQPAIHAPTPTPSAIPTETRFFKFRFGSSIKETTNSSPVTSPSATSPSRSGTPTLAPPAASISPQPDNNTELQRQLVQERAAHDSLRASHSALQASLADLQTSNASLFQSRKELETSKKALEEELESLSQALFEEANRMVADERRRRAAYQEELEAVRAEREALQGALKVVEGENWRLRAETNHQPVIEENEDAERQSAEGTRTSEDSVSPYRFSRYPRSADRSSMIVLRPDSPPRDCLDVVDEDGPSIYDDSSTRDSQLVTSIASLGLDGPGAYSPSPIPFAQPFEPPSEEKPGTHRVLAHHD